MNTRFTQVISRTANYLEELFKRSSHLPLPVVFQRRHAEHLAAAGFGFRNTHDYYAAAKAGSEHCSGYYIPDSAMIVSRMTELGYPPVLAEQCINLFVQAVCNSDGSVRADIFDDLHGDQMRVSGTNLSANHSLLTQHFKYDILREESRLWTTLVRHGIEHDRETEDNVRCSISLMPDFPSHAHLERTIDVPFVAFYDLDQGEDQEALFYQRNRQLGFRGSLRLSPSGKRGWAYPTMRLEETPFVDDRTQDEIEGNYPVHQDSGIDNQEFENGNAAGDANKQPPVHASFDFLAGWIMTAYDVNSTGHMSTGQIEKAFYGALANAEELGTFNKRGAHQLAAQACRHLASNRIRRALEALIQESAEVEERW